MVNKVIISGGGTGGHVFPAIAIANALRRIRPDIEILFVGAEGKMEMEKVPAAGYSIEGLDIQGFDRKSILKNLILPFKMLKSLIKSRNIIKTFKADVAVGVGGYASGPLLLMANIMGIPTLIQEQNSFAGKTNISLGKKAKRICVAYDGMEKFFSKKKLLFTGNPIRRSSVDIEGKKSEAMQWFGLKENVKTVLVTGGSLGAATLNNCLIDGLEIVSESGVQFIWQCGSYYYQTLLEKTAGILPGNVKLLPFLERMDYAYAAADVIVARAGAGTISELCAVGKPCVLVPSPNVAEDHQTKNAMALVNKGAVWIVKDVEARSKLLSQILTLVNQDQICKSLSVNIKKLALLDADEVIAKEVLNLKRI